jgi:hypothetical protein
MPATHTARSTKFASRRPSMFYAFQKKSPRGIETRQSDVALVRERLKVAQRDYEERHG